MHFDFQAAKVPHIRAAAVSSRIVRWIPPILPHAKINFDVAIFKDSDSAGIVVVVRNNSGTVIAALSQRVLIPTSAAMVEVLACRRAMDFAKDISALDCIFEGDAEVVIIAICKKDVSHPEYGNVIEDILVLAKEFHFSSFCLVKRSGNKVAHHLARRSNSGCELQVCFDTTPEE